MESASTGKRSGERGRDRGERPERGSDTREEREKQTDWISKHGSRALRSPLWPLLIHVLVFTSTYPSVAIAHLLPWKAWVACFPFESLERGEKRERQLGSKDGAGGTPEGAEQFGSRLTQLLLCTLLFMAANGPCWGKPTWFSFVILRAA